MTAEREAMPLGSTPLGSQPTRTAPVDLTAAPRAVLRESVRLLNRVLGEDRLGSARANAWEAVVVDRERARERAEVARVIASARRTR